MEGNYEPIEIECILQLEDVQTLYTAICDAIKTWPGSPARPPEEQENFHYMKTFLFKMMCEASMYR